MTAGDKDRNYGRKSDGRFTRGNPGKPSGARHKATQAVEALLNGEAVQLARKAVEMALGGDTTALKLCLDRVAPTRKGRPVVFALPPIQSASDVLAGLQSVLLAVSEGTLTPEEGMSVASLLEVKRRTIEAVDFEARLAQLEEKQNET